MQQDQPRGRSTIAADFQSQMIKGGDFEDGPAAFDGPVTKQTRSTTMVGDSDKNLLETGETREFDVNNITISKL